MTLDKQGDCSWKLYNDIVSNFSG